MKIKRMFTAVLAAAVCLSFTSSAYAGNQVTDITVDVTLQPDGSAYVVQTWNGSFSEGTECYFPMTNLGDITLSELQVSDGAGSYIPADTWDTGASFEEKARRCGLNPVDDGYEICWGISEYGSNRYAVEYKLGGLVGAYEDADGFLFQFVPDGMNTGPVDVTVHIVTQDGTKLSEDNAGIWAFGFEGQSEFSEGGVQAYTEKPLTEDNSIILMLRLDRGIVAPAREASGTFEAVRDKAFEGSSYDSNEESGMGGSLYWLPGLLGIAGAGILFWLKFRNHKLKKLYNNAEYWRRVPIGGNLEASFVLSDRFMKVDEGNLIAAVLVRLLAAGCLMPESSTDTGLMGNEKRRISLRLVKPPTMPGLAVIQLYDLLAQAAGIDGIIQEQELEAYCKKNYTALLNVVNEARRDGGETLADIGCYRPLYKTDDVEGLTDRGRGLLLQLLGYKKYLLDFSLIADRGAKEALIWQDCLTYAALLGIGEQVLKELKELYPGLDSGIGGAESVYYTAYRYRTVTYAAAKGAQTAATRSQGGGGFTSLGGGGGFSGGGHGGGTR